MMIDKMILKSNKLKLKILLCLNLLKLIKINLLIKHMHLLLIYKKKNNLIKIRFHIW